jgi:putative oxidoreductase
MSALISSTGSRPEWGTLAVRLAVGAVMITAGWIKLFVVGIEGPESISAYFAALGIPLPVVMAYFISLLELVGGVLLVIGLFARPIALLLICDMVVAIILVSSQIGWMNMEGKSGIESNVLLIAGLLVIFFSGAGRLSLDGKGQTTTA